MNHTFSCIVGQTGLFNVDRAPRMKTTLLKTLEKNQLETIPLFFLKSHCYSDINVKETVESHNRIHPEERWNLIVLVLSYQLFFFCPLFNVDIVCFSSSSFMCVCVCLCLLLVILLWPYSKCYCWFVHSLGQSAHQRIRFLRLADSLCHYQQQQPRQHHYKNHYSNSATIYDLPSFLLSFTSGGGWRWVADDCLSCVSPH